MLKLDIGCGHNPIGDVNIDPFPSPTSHRSIDQRLCDDKSIDISKTSNFVMAVGESIPIRSGLFDYVFSSHVIEHSNNPQIFLKEMYRMTKDMGVIRIICPHRFEPSRGIKKHHVNHFNLKWFITSFHTLGLEIIEIEINFYGFPHEYFSLLRLPKEINIAARRTR